MKRDWFLAFVLSLMLHGVLFGAAGLMVGSNDQANRAAQTAPTERPKAKDAKPSQKEQAHGRPTSGVSKRLSISISMVVSAQNPEAGATSGLNLGMVTHKTLPDYPLISRLWGEEGTALVLVSIEKGQVVSVALERTSGSWRLDRAALDALSSWRFRAGVSGMVRIPVEFRLGTH